MQLRQIESPEKWTEFWLEKLAAELEKNGCEQVEIIAQKDIIRKYLTKHSGNPRMIDVEKMLAFVAIHKIDSIKPLSIFYDAISHSEKHTDALKTVVFKKATSPPKKIVAPVKKATAKKPIKKNPTLKK